jgi:hypothetical protein
MKSIKNEGGVRMNVGDRIKFQFAAGEKEGIVERIFSKKVYLKVDFPGQPGKRLIRPLAALEGTTSSPRRKKKTKVGKPKEKKAEGKQEKALAENK